MDNVSFTTGLKATPINVRISTAAAATSMALAGALPPRYFLAVHTRGIFDQKDVQCCVSCAFASAMETLDASWPPLSVLYHYWTALSMAQGSGKPRPDSLTLEEGVAPLGVKGIASLSVHHPDITVAGAATAPSPEADIDARTRRLAFNFGGLQFNWCSLSHISLEAEVKLCLLRNQPVVIGFRLPKGFRDNLAGMNCRWLDPLLEAEQPETRHAVLAVGYDDTERAICVQDSQGFTFGESGKWWMGYQVLNSAVAFQAIALQT